jgi:hypothetical protein
MKMAIEIRALLIALGESYYQMSQLQSEVAQNAAELQHAVGRYSGVADSAEMPGVALNFDPPPPPRDATGSAEAGRPPPVTRPTQPVFAQGPRLVAGGGATASTGSDRPRSVMDRVRP